MTAGLLLAWPACGLWRRDTRLSKRLACAVAMPFALPSIVFGVGLGVLWAVSGGLGTMPAGILSHAAHHGALRLATISAGPPSIDRAHLDVAATLDAPERIAVRAIALPQTISCTLSGRVFALALSSTEFIVMVLASPSTHATATLQIFNSLRRVFTLTRAMGAIVFTLTPSPSSAGSPASATCRGRWGPIRPVARKARPMPRQPLFVGAPVALVLDTRKGGDPDGCDVGLARMPGSRANRGIDAAESVHCVDGLEGYQIAVVETGCSPVEDCPVPKRRYSRFPGPVLEILLKGIKTRTLALGRGLTDARRYDTSAAGHQHEHRRRIGRDAVGGSSDAAHAASLRAMAHLQERAPPSTADILAGLAALRSAA
ncbi:hypothetical protein [uncultured Albimonas sp.]|uniref:hypothetical protein n=1 Tax=uncultured Albimonas sp. TaxID=1331701 RepID=UPI0030EF7DCF